MAAKKKPKDWRAEVEALRDAIKKDLQAKPGKDRKQSALQDAWVAVLRPRVKRVVNKVEDLLKAKRWERDEDDAGIALKPVHWNHVVNQIATDVYVDLAGALRGYLNVRPVWRAKVRFGILKGRNAPVGTKKQIDAQKKAADEARKKLEKARNEAYKATMDLVLKGLQGTRDAIQASLDGLQGICDGLMKVEARRLKALRTGAPEAERAKGGDEIEAMELLRLDARSFSLDGGRGGSKYTGLLVKWNGARKRAAAALG
jgi:hypothetical protein